MTTASPLDRQYSRRDDAVIRFSGDGASAMPAASPSAGTRMILIDGTFPPQLPLAATAASAPARVHCSCPARARPGQE